MDREAALARLRSIVAGIDKEDIEPGGWWETSGGADVGADKLAQLEGLVEELTRE